MRILILGSEGNIGRVLVSYLKSQGMSVHRADQVHGIGDDYSIVNTMNTASMIQVFEDFRPELVYLLAGVVGRLVNERSRMLALNVNVVGTVNVASLCKIYNSRLVFFSTSEVYGDAVIPFGEDTRPEPNNFYALTKKMAEDALLYAHRNDKLDVVIVRPFMLYHQDEDFGEHRSMIIRAAKAIIEGRKVDVYRGSVRSWLNIDDFVRIVDVISMCDYDIVNIGNDEYTEIQDVISYMCELAGRKYKDCAVEKPLPEKMIFTKKADFSRQNYICNMKKISIYAGVEKVMKRVKERLS
jgi:nucleoside-diphosphate-sugar epimerase